MKYKSAVKPQPQLLKKQREMLNNPDKVEELIKLVLTKFKDNEKYYEVFIKNKSPLEKRKFLSLLLLISTNLELDDLIYLEVQEFLSIISQINEAIEKYSDFDTKNNKKEEANKNKLGSKLSRGKETNYLTIHINNKKLILNSRFSEFFKEDLYLPLTYNKKKTTPLLSSVHSKAPLTKHNLKKDLCEQIVELI